MLSEGVPVCQLHALDSVGPWIFAKERKLCDSWKIRHRTYVPRRYLGGEHGIFLEDVRKSLRGMQQYI